MTINKFIILIFTFTITFSTPIFAIGNLDKTNSIEFFASNNTQEINLQNAFHRLRGIEQEELQYETIHLMQKEHVEQGKFENLLGTYSMLNDNKITADNSEIFITSSYQKLSSEKIFNIAKQLATTLKQESVAVFIPSEQSDIGNLVLNLKSHQYSIPETIKLIHEKLPKQYSQAFSLHLNKTCSDFQNTSVKEVEWLGSKIKTDEIKNSFPHEKISYSNGKAYLVYQNGQIKQL